MQPRENHGVVVVVVVVVVVAGWRLTKGEIISWRCSATANLKLNAGEMNGISSSRTAATHTK
jgi:hypothetical protein